MDEKARVALIILDGWGIGSPWGGNAIVSANTLNFDFYWRRYAKTTLSASGQAVGLPSGASGNSETGHLNIGAGRIVPQDLPYINDQIKSGEFFKNPKILAAFDQTKKNKSHLHLMGLVGPGKVHSDINHLFALLKMAKDNGITDVCLDLFTDGRDSDPSLALSISDLVSTRIKQIGVGRITSLCGRYYAMDRDHNWGRTSRAYNALTKGEADLSPSCREAISKSYLQDISDEFILPHLIVPKGEEKTLILDNDVVIFFNFRPDRARQISQAFGQKPISEMPDRKIVGNLYFLTFVVREPNPTGIQVFEPQPIPNCLTEVISKNNLKQFHIAETEKYAHVTYFFDGGHEQPFPNEIQCLVPSLKIATYDLAPSMSAGKITEDLIAVSGENYDLIVANYANTDMVGHSGNYFATVQAIEFIDACLGKVVNSLLKYNYIVIITGDHGNADQMINSRTNQPDTEHTSNPVPFLLVTKNIYLAKIKLKSNGSLSNIAPTILDIMNIEKPKEMTAESLIWRANV